MLVFGPSGFTFRSLRLRSVGFPVFSAPHECESPWADDYQSPLRLVRFRQLNGRLRESQEMRPRQSSCIQLTFVYTSQTVTLPFQDSRP